MPTQTTPGRAPQVRRSRTTRAAASSEPAAQTTSSTTIATGSPARPPAPRPAPRPEPGPQRAMREAEEQFRMLLANHIQDMRRRGVGEDVLGPFERELLRMGPARR